MGRPKPARRRVAQPPSGLMGRTISEAESSAGRQTYVATQQSIIPVPPMIPKCLKPRKSVIISEPYETMPAPAAASVDIQVSRCASHSEAPTPALRRASM